VRAIDACGERDVLGRVRSLHSLGVKVRFTYERIPVHVS
jgi:hypothetical protein